MWEISCGNLTRTDLGVAPGGAKRGVPIYCTGYRQGRASNYPVIEAGSWEIVPFNELYSVESHAGAVPDQKHHHSGFSLKFLMMQLYNNWIQKRGVQAGFFFFEWVASAYPRPHIALIYAPMKQLNVEIEPGARLYANRPVCGELESPPTPYACVNWRRAFRRLDVLLSLCQSVTA